MIGDDDPEEAPAPEGDWTVSAFMAAPAVVSGSDTVLKVCELMSGGRIGQILVAPEGWRGGAQACPEPAGIFTERDLIRALVRHRVGLLELPVSAVMTSPVVGVGPDEDILHAADLMTLLRCRRLPVVREGLLVGVVTRGRVMEAQARRLALLARQNRDLERQAEHDPLTGLGNRALFTRVLAHELDGARVHGGGVSVLEIDIDHFKRVNDSLGHPAGDRVLAGLARVLRRELRRADLAARVGGEEFAVVLGRGAGDPKAVAEKLRRAVAAEDFGAPGAELRVSVSVGCATSRPGEDGEALFARVDAALYRAKNLGRDRVEAEA